ncbi:MAG: hypothetical protein KDD45_17960 [Bdellovibrionales bacterium]|nr:hypothetical protein [Bdellovibrionales bacterium]
MWITGYGKDASNNEHWIIRKYDGSVWTTEDDFTFGAGTSMARAKSIYKTSSGIIYVAGEYRDSNYNTHWVVRRKNLSGLWETIDDFQLATDGSASPTKIIEFDNRVLVVGFAFDSNYERHALIRVFKNNQWYTVDKYNIVGLGVFTDVVSCDLGGSRLQLCLSGISLNSDNKWLGFFRFLSP